MILAVLVVVVVLSLAAYQFTEVMSSEYAAAVRTTDTTRAKANAVSGLHFVAAALSNPDYLNTTLAGNPFDAPTQFAGVVVGPSDNPRQEGRFALVHVVSTGGTDNTYETKYGVADESGKLNINALIQLDSSGQLLHDVLMKLPNMSEDIADAIVDWVDPDDDARTNGAESSYYLALGQPYRCKNGPLNSLDELLLVKGMTWQLLYGNDRNRNGIADDTPDGSQQLDRGWVDFLTVYGRELNLDSTGAPRVYIGGSDNLPQLYQDLQAAVPDLADYIMAYKLFGGAAVSGSGSSSGGSAGGRFTFGSQSGGAGGTQATTVTGTADQLSAAIQTALSGTPTAKGKITSVFGLMNTQVTLPQASPQTGMGGSTTGTGGQTGGQTQPTVVVPSPLNDPTKLSQLLPLLMDKTTTSQNMEATPRINIMTAPREVLMALVPMSARGGTTSSTSSSTSSTGATTSGGTTSGGTTGSTGATGSTGSTSASGTMGSTGSTGTTTSTTTLADTDIDTIISARTGLDPTDPAAQTGVWLVTTAGLDPKILQSLEKYVTGRTMVYRAQSIGYFTQGGPVSRVEAVIDTNQGAPRFLYFRDLSDLDNPRGFDPPRE